MENTSFIVPSISCNVCCDKIRNTISQMNGVENVSVDLVSKTVNVSFNEQQVSASSIKKEVSSIGYEIQ